MKKKKEELTSEELTNMFNSFSANAKIQILSDAIDYMQQYNGRTKTACIALAMGYEFNDLSETFKLY